MAIHSERYDEAVSLIRHLEALEEKLARLERKAFGRPTKSDVDTYTHALRITAAIIDEQIPR